jgi:hypothetical protein
VCFAELDLELRLLFNLSHHKSTEFTDAHQLIQGEGNSDREQNSDEECESEGFKHLSHAGSRAVAEKEGQRYANGSY